MIAEKIYKLFRLAEDTRGNPSERAQAAIRFVDALSAVPPRTKNGLPFVLTTSLPQDRYRSVVMPFGKYKGELVSNVPVDYLVWARMNLTRLPFGLREAFDFYIASEEP